MDPNTKAVFVQWALYTVVPVVVSVVTGWLSSWWTKKKLIKPELAKYDKYLSVAQEVVESAAVICLAGEQERKSKAVEILQNKLNISEAGADYIAQKAYVIYKDALEKLEEKIQK